MTDQFSILIVARNAAATIERAIASALPEGCPIVLVDDHCADDTVVRARAIAGSRLTVLHAPRPGGVGRARQCALDAVTTPFAAWLDADDEWVPGRADRLLGHLRAGCDVAIEAIDLHDGPSGAWQRRLTVPAFVRGAGSAVRLFERNVLPGDTQLAFRTSAFRLAGGYDADVCGPESFDLLLRAIAGGSRLAVGDEVGYRMYAYPGSLSRNLSRQRSALARALEKHSYDTVRALYDDAGYSARVTAWAVVALAQFRGDAETAVDALDEAYPSGADPDQVLEPEGPWPQPEGWRHAFHRGTLLLQQRGGTVSAAIRWLEDAETRRPTAEGANNLGVAYARAGEAGRAAESFTTALARFPGFVDPWRNLESSTPSHVTTHPLRHAPSRIEY